MESLKEIVNELEVKVYGMDNEEKKLEVRVNEIEAKIASGNFGGSSGGSDDHKIC